MSSEPQPDWRYRTRLGAAPSLLVVTLGGASPDAVLSASVCPALSRREVAGRLARQLHVAHDRPVAPLPLSAWCMRSQWTGNVPVLLSVMPVPQSGCRGQRSGRRQASR
jgi:hypothetical protein